MQSITYSITNLKFSGLVNLQFWAWFFFSCNGKFSEKTSVYGEFFHILNAHNLCRGHSNSVLKGAEMRRGRDSLGKQKLLRDIRQGGNCISWGRAGLPSFPSLPFCFFLGKSKEWHYWLYITCSVWLSTVQGWLRTIQLHICKFKSS